jgi:hypothetical protein
MKVMPLMLTSTLYFLISYLKPFQNGVCSYFLVECKTCSSQRDAVTFCMLLDLERVKTSEKSALKKQI